MNTIKEDVMGEKIEIKKSVFTTFVNKISCENDAIVLISVIKKNYPDATHICYAYIVDNIERCTDDGEPSGTAGKPILNVLKQKKLTNVLVVVVRYFGGVKLGAGGLVRAYTIATTSCLEKVSIIEIKNICKVSFHIDYDKAFNIYLLTNLNYFSILERVGNDFVISCGPQDLDKTLNSIKRYNVTNLKIEYVKV